MLKSANRSNHLRPQMFKGFAAFFLVASMACVSQAASAEDSDSPVVKKSSSGICHDASSRHFTRVKNFDAYDSMEACLSDGGRKPNH